MGVFRPKELETCSLVCVPPWMAVDTWPMVEAMVVEAYRRGGHEMPRNITVLLDHGVVLLWLALAPDAVVLCAALTRLVDKDCWVLAASGGRMREWLPFHQELERYARGEGCVRMRLRGRRGWLRVLSGYSAGDGDHIEKVL